MAHQTQEIPSLDDFTESSLLDQITDKKNQEEEETEEEKTAKKAKEAEAKENEEKEKAEEEAAALAEEQEEELTDEEKEALAKEKEKEEEEKEEEEGSFWEDVEKITGVNYDIDYGDVDPDTPEGAAIREEFIVKKAVEDNLTYLEEKFPDGFKALMHISNGGKLTDLMKEGEIDYSSITIKEDDVESQKEFLKNYYIDKGFSKAKAIRNVEDDEDSEEGLLENFKAALKEKQVEQQQKTEAILQKQAEIKAAQDAQDKQFGQTVSSIINTGKVGNFNIPKADAETFYNYVLSNIQRNGNGYAVTIPLTNENFQQQLQQLFFGFKKGDLSKYIATKASTQNAKRLKRSLKKEKDGTEYTSESEKRKYGNKLPTLGMFEAE